MMAQVYYDYQLRKTRWKFGDKVLDLKLVLPQATFLLSSGNTIVACNFASFAANEIKG